MMMGCQRVSDFELTKKDAYRIGDTITLENTQFQVIEAKHHVIDQSLFKDEKLIYIYIDYEGELFFSSSSLKILLPSGQEKTAYMVDGLDYLVGPQQASIPYVRFSVPNNTQEFILKIDQNIHIYITWT